MTRCSAATVSGNCWRRICFYVTTRHTQRSRDASWLFTVYIYHWHWHWYCYIWAPAIEVTEDVELAWSISWPHGVNGNLNQPLISIGLIFLMLVASVDCCLTLLCWMMNEICWYYVRELCAKVGQLQLSFRISEIWCRSRAAEDFGKCLQDRWWRKSIARQRQCAGKPALITVLRLEIKRRSDSPPTNELQWTRSIL